MSQIETHNELGRRLRQVYESIYRQHRQGLYTLALSIAGRPDRAEDAVHDAFVRLFDSGRTPEGDVLAYTFASVRNAAIDQRRRSATQPPPMGDLIYADRAADDAAKPEASLIEAEEERRLREAISALPAEQAEIVLLKTHAGLTFEQIAQTLGQPMGTVTSRYRRALEKLREQLNLLEVGE